MGKLIKNIKKVNINLYKRINQYLSFRYIKRNIINE